MVRDMEVGWDQFLGGGGQGELLRLTSKEYLCFSSERWRATVEAFAGSNVAKSAS